VKILIVDDEPLARARLRRLLAQLRPQAQLLEAADGGSALALVDAEHPELLLLDVRMPGQDGLAVAAALAERAAPPAVVFCTAYDEYALQALDNRAIGYLLKPVREADLRRALDNAVRLNSAQIAALRGEDGRRDIVSVGHRGLQTLPFADIRCFVAEDKYVRALAPQGEILVNDTLKDLEAEFGARLLRVHRNALVARAHLCGLRREGGSWVAELQGVDLRPQVSRRHLSGLKAALLGG
jgi:two-component system response regulator AlgR